MNTGGGLATAADTPDEEGNVIGGIGVGVGVAVGW